MLKFFIYYKQQWDQFSTYLQHSSHISDMYVLQIQGVTVMTVNTVSQYSCVYTQLCKKKKKKPTGETKPPIVACKQVPITSLLVAFAFCGLGKGTGVFYHQEISISSDKQPCIYLLWVISCPHFLGGILKFESCK